MKLIKQISFLTLIAFMLIMTGCDKTKPYDVIEAEPQVHFNSSPFQTYPVLVDPTPVFNITIGTTDVSDADRVVSYKVVSPSGAVEGTQYTIDNSGSVTIPAGKSEATIDIRAKFAAYAGGRRDTLIFTLTNPSIKPSLFSDSVTLILKGPVTCSEDLIDINAMVGDYQNTTEVFDGGAPYGPYATAISSVTSTGATTARIVVENIFDDGWGPISFDLDWTDLANRTCVVVDGNISGTDSGPLFGAAYAGIPLWVTEPFGAIGGSPKGTYSYCNETFTLQMEIGPSGVGFYEGLYTVNMAR